jgi:Holliday junction resolvase RusA-like endonuclease
MILFQVTIPGRPYVKKNQQKAVGNGRFKKIIYSPKYVAWEQMAVLTVRQMLQKMPVPGIAFPVNLKVVFYFKDRQAEPDLSALYEGIQDVLQKEGVIANDKLIVGHDGSTKLFGHEPRTEVEITVRHQENPPVCENERKRRKSN